MLLFFLTLYNVEAKAQFYSVNFVSHTADTLSASADPYANGYSPFPDAKDAQARAKETRFHFAERSQPSQFSSAKIVTNPATKKQTQEKQSKSGQKTFLFPKRKVTKKQDFPLFNATDSLVLELIRKRLTVCMPLNLVHLTSRYGYRKDPFEKCQKFHDGIDLRAGHEVVYSMLPGRVVKVRHGNTGYGNHIVIDHGRLRCLYAHLSEIYAKEGDIVDAGTIVSLTGATGRATSSHLHLKLSKFSDNGQWVSVNPMPFINSLNDYINEYNERLDALLGKERYNSRGNIPELTVANLYAELKRQGVKHPKIVLAQAILESGWFRSDLTRTHNNIFGIRTRKGPYQRFESWIDCVSGYKNLVQYKFKGTTQNEYYAFLRNIGYAADRNYIYKVREIAERL